MAAADGEKCEENGELEAGRTLEVSRGRPLSSVIDITWWPREQGDRLFR